MGYSALKKGICRKAAIKASKHYNLFALRLCIKLSLKIAITFCLTSLNPR